MGARGMAAFGTVAGLSWVLWSLCVATRPLLWGWGMSVQPITWGMEREFGSHGCGLAPGDWRSPWGGAGSLQGLCRDLLPGARVSQPHLLCRSTGPGSGSALAVGRTHSLYVTLVSRLSPWSFKAQLMDLFHG